METDTLYLYRNTLTGEIPTTFGNLDLFEFQAYENRLTGEIPEEFYNNRNLQLLRIDFNSITGTISSSLGNMADLQDLRINENLLSGPLPASIGNLNNLSKFESKCLSVSNFIIKKNDLTFLSSSMGSSYPLFRIEVVLRVNDNSFSEAIPDGFGSWGDLDFADFSNNQFTGSIPASIFDIPTIRILYLSNNFISGPLPDNYSDPPVLRDLFINGNSITGQVPGIASGQLMQLTEFLLQDNQFTGSMPSSICNLRGIGILDDLWADCSDNADFELECRAPQCCTLCFPS